jgi:predicted sugar kinase
MSATIANSVLNIISTFSEEDLAIFNEAYEKMQKPKTKTKAKNRKPIVVKPSIEECMNIIKAKYNISEQANKLA